MTIMIRNAFPYLVTPGYQLDGALLNRRPARPCGATETRTDGFVVPCDHSDGLIHKVGGINLICLQTEDKILPGAVVADVLADRVEQFEHAQGFKPGRKAMTELKESVIAELLPQAFSMKRRTFAMFAGQYFIIDTSSSARADLFISAIGSALGELPIRGIQTKSMPTIAMIKWLLDGEAPEDFSIDTECVLENKTEAKTTIKYQRTDICAEDVRSRVVAGCAPKNMAMTFRDRLSFVLTESLAIKRLCFLDIITEQARSESESSEELFDAELMISAGETTQLLDRLIEELGGLVEQEQDLASPA